MHIVDTLGRCSITIDHLLDGPSYDSFLFEASVDIGHGFFKARNTDVHFLDLPIFVADLDRFRVDKTLRPRLNGTYDSYLELPDTPTSVTIRFRVGDAFAGYRDLDASFALSGEFGIDPDLLSSIIEKFRDLLESWNNCRA